MSRAFVSLVERGHLDQVSLAMLRRVGGALDIRVDVVARWRAGELDRLLNARHSALHESVARFFTAASGWIFAPEVSFSVYGERGVIDILAFHAASGCLLVIELKTEIVDVQELVGTFDRKMRLARDIAAARGWHVRSVSGWIIAERRPDEPASHRGASVDAAGGVLGRWARDALMGRAAVRQRPWALDVDQRQPGQP